MKRMRYRKERRMGGGDCSREMERPAVHAGRSVVWKVRRAWALLPAVTPRADAARGPGADYRCRDCRGCRGRCPEKTARAPTAGAPTAGTPRAEPAGRKARKTARETAPEPGRRAGTTAIRPAV